METSNNTKKELSVNGERIDIFLNNRYKSIKAYFSSILGFTNIKNGRFVDSILYHITK